MTGLTLKLGTLIVLEGLDRTGKSTQSDALRRELDPATTHHLHMPSGMTAFTEETYSMLESADRAPSSGLATQLAHLACHAESVPQIQRILETGAVVLDRWWWSTFAYGWYSGDIPAAGVSEDSFRNLVNSIWSPLAASVVFLFDKPYRDDANNADLIMNGYRELAGSEENAVRVPQGSPTEVTKALLAEVRRRELLAQ